MRMYGIIMILCALAIPIVGAGSNEAQPDAGDPNMGDWQADSGQWVAQVFALEGGKWQANLLRAFDAADKPLAVLEGAPSGDKIAFSGDGWSGAIVGGRFTGQKGDEQFQMRRVTRNSPTLNAAAPKGALALFDGTNLDEWVSQAPKDWLNSDGPATDWKIVPGGVLEVVPAAGSIITKKQFGDFKLHVEFRLLGVPTNSGVYLSARYEVNIKNAYGLLEGVLCGQLANATDVAPRLNAAAPDFQWQTLDIDFRAPRFSESGERTEKARATVVHNGLAIYDNVELEAPKGAAKRLGEAPAGPIMLQEHGSPLQFRNIWIVERAK